MNKKVKLILGFVGILCLLALVIIKRDSFKYKFQNLKDKYIKEYLIDQNNSEEVISTYRKDPDRFIAHAGGGIDNLIYTDSKEALDENYKKGFRLFELDIVESSDGKFVAAHDWQHWANITGYKEKTPVSKDEFLKHKLHGKYSPLTMVEINQWFENHKEAILVTDKINKPIKFANQFVDKKRLIMELFTENAVHEANEVGIKSPMISEAVLEKLKKDKLKFIVNNKIKYIAISRNKIIKYYDLIQELNKNNIKVYVYSITHKEGGNEEYVLKHEVGFVYGMYADEFKISNN